MNLHGTEHGPLFVRMPPINLEPTPLQELRDVLKDVAYVAAWSLVRAGLWLSRKFEPCTVCPRCGPYPVINSRDGRCLACGAEVYESGETEEFVP